MLFRGSPVNRPVRIVAIVVLVCMSAPFLASIMSALAAPVVGGIMGVGFAGIVWQYVLWRRERKDPYDLKQLWDELPDEPEEIERTDNRSLTYCRHCDSAVTAPHSICPNCGVPLGS